MFFPQSRKSSSVINYEKRKKQLCGVIKIKHLNVQILIANFKNGVPGILEKLRIFILENALNRYLLLRIIFCLQTCPFEITTHACPEKNYSL